METASDISEVPVAPSVAEIAPSSSRPEPETTSENREVEKQDSGPAVKRGGFKSKPSLPSPKPTPPPARAERRAYLSFLFTLNQFAWDILLFKNQIRTVLIMGAIVFAVILTVYPLFHCLVLILLLGFAVSSVYSIFLLLFRIIVGKPATHPFRHLLSQTETQLDPGLFENWTVSTLEVFGPVFNFLLRLVLFYDLRMSIAFLVLLYAASYVTIYITLPYILTAALATSFLAPKLYSLSQDSVDSLIGRLLDKYRKVAARIEKVVDTE